MKLKKAGSLLLLLILILTSCGFDSDKPNEERLRKEKKNYTVTVSNKAGEAGIKAVEEFCDKAKLLSGGDLTLTYKVSEDALADFYDGADFIFASNSEIARANGDFASYTSPYYFESCKKALLTLNSKEFLEHTSDITQSLLNGKQLGCFYNGTSVFISNNVDNLFIFDDEGERLTDFENLRVYGGFDYIDEYILSKLGIDVVKAEKDEIFQKFNDAQSHTVMVKKHDLGSLKLSPKRDQLFYYSQPYRYDFNWLFISDEVLEDMYPGYVDIIKEAAAYALGLNDTYLFEKEKESRDSIEAYPITYMDYSIDGAKNFVEEAFRSVRFKRTWDVNNHETIKNILE